MSFIKSNLCIKCKGKGLCGGPCKVYQKIKKLLPKKITHFSGKSPPEIFVGRHNYPNIQAGILTPNEIKNTEEMAYPEIWHSKNFSINQILKKRNQLIYGKFKTSIKKHDKLKSIMQEVSMSSNPVETEIFLKKPVIPRFEIERNLPFIGNPAPLQKAKLQENPKTNKKVEYLSSDKDAKAGQGIQELYNSKINTTDIIKILSTGLLGKKLTRKLVPTRWAITAVDDTLSKKLLKKIKYYPEINEIQLFHSEYIGNHYEIILIPENFSFEIIEAYFPGSSWNPEEKIKFSKDYEYFNGRKTYASNVTGAYYTARLAITEYLEKIKKQATVIIFREEKPEYNAPLGVGILRQICRKALSEKPEKFENLTQTLNKINQRLSIPVQEFMNHSTLIKETGKQKKLKDFISKNKPN